MPDFKTSAGLFDAEAEFETAANEEYETRGVVAIKAAALAKVKDAARIMVAVAEAAYDKAQDANIKAVAATKVARAAYRKSAGI